MSLTLYTILGYIAVFRSSGIPLKKKSRQCLRLESKIRSKYFQKWRAKLCLILESLVAIKVSHQKYFSKQKKNKILWFTRSTDSMRNPSATAFSGHVFELPKNPLNAMGTVYIKYSSKMQTVIKIRHYQQCTTRYLSQSGRIKTNC